MPGRDRRGPAVTARAWAPHVAAAGVRAVEVDRSDRQDRRRQGKRDSIEAHLTIVFAALAVSRWIERQTGWSIRKFVKTARRYRTIEVQAGPHIISAADGWYLVTTAGSHRQYKHPLKPGRVTIAGKPSAELPPGTERSILRQSGLDRRTP